MGAKVQSKTYFPGSMADLNNGFHNLYHDDKTRNGTTQHYDYMLTTQAMDGYNGYAKEQIRQTILKHESIFKHQLQELHRLYKRQKDLMNPVSTEPLNFGHFHVPSNLPQMNPSFSRASTSRTDNMFSSTDSIKGKGTLHEYNPLISKCGFFDVDASNKGKVFNLADLNEPVQVEDRETAFSAFFSNKIKSDELSAKRALFGMEVGENNHTPSFALPWRNRNTTSHHNIWLSSFGSTSQTPGLFDGNSRLSLTPKSTSQNAFIDLEKNRFLDMWKNRETPEQKLPSWLTSKPLQTEQVKTNVHHINLDALQNHSQQFFKKTENADTNDNDTRSITKILGVPIIDKKVENHCEESKDIKHNIDLNLSLDEEDGSPTAPSFPESVVKIATMEIDLEAPAVLEPDPDDGSTDNNNNGAHMELVKGAAEAIVSISLSQSPSTDTLLWFAEVVIKSNEVKENKDSVPEGMDYFEYMTLKLEDTEDKYYNYVPIIMEEQKEAENENGVLSKRAARKAQGRRGRQRKDFQKDILPSMVSLSRREVTEDLQTFEEALSATGVCWQSTKRKAAARNGKVRRRLVDESSCSRSPPAACGGGKERVVSLEESLEGWGRRTRRLPRQRCQNGGNHNQSVALKC